jgi:hypothetical protein
VIDDEDLFSIQWSSLDFLTNQDITLHDNAPKIKSFKDLTDSNSIQVSPEFSYFKNYYQDEKYTPSLDSVNLTKS